MSKQQKSMALPCRILWSFIILARAFSASKMPGVDCNKKQANKTAETDIY